MNVIDNGSPVITLIGEAIESVEVGTVYNDAGGDRLRCGGWGPDREYRDRGFADRYQCRGPTTP